MKKLNDMHLLACMILSLAMVAKPEMAGAQSSVGLPDSMELATAYLSRSQLASGFFPYDYNFSTGASADMSDISGVNLVRQTGAAFALSEQYVRSPSERTGSTLRRILSVLAERSVPVGRSTLQTFLENTGIYNRWRLWGIARKPLNALGLLYSASGPGLLVSANNTYQRAWSGATALAVITALNYQTRSGDTQFDEALHAWVQGLLALQVPGRGFREAPHYLSESPYVNGEAWFALARYARAYPDNIPVQEALVGLDAYLIERYSSHPMSRFFAWGAMATAERAGTTTDKRFLEFLKQQTAWFLADPQARFIKGENHCAKIEGLAASVLALQSAGPENDALLKQVRAHIRQAMSESLALQIQPGQTEIRLNDGRLVRSREMLNSAGAFLISADSPTIQVDMAGHCISASVRMERAGL